jgi:hypothetical protein
MAGAGGAFGLDPRSEEGDGTGDEIAESATLMDASGARFKGQE